MNERVCISYFAYYYYYYYYYSPRSSIGDLSQCWLFFLMPFGIPPPKDLNSRKLDIKVLKRVIDFCLFSAFFRLELFWGCCIFCFSLYFTSERHIPRKARTWIINENPQPQTLDYQRHILLITLCSVFLGDRWLFIIDIGGIIWKRSLKIPKG